MGAVAHVVGAPLLKPLAGEGRQVVGFQPHSSI